MMQFQDDRIISGTIDIVPRPLVTQRQCEGDSPRGASPPLTRQRWIIIALFIFVATFAIRAIQFGNPLIHVDENFYLLVGDRLLQGALPYVDIWDRKPIGLFLLYAAIRLLGGTGIIEYQIVATLFAAGTALLIVRMAARIAGPVAATASGIFYILLLDLCGGSGGQAPVFYNLFVAAAALLVSRTPEARQAGTVRRLGCIAMVLVGIAIQIKYTVIFEGSFAGLFLLYQSWRTSGSVRRTIVDGTLWVAIALAPTMLAIAYYAWRGELQAFEYANFLSVGVRSPATSAVLLDRLGRALEELGIPLLGVLLSTRSKSWRAMPNGSAVFAFVMAWLGAAIFGYLIFGTYFNHYALPVCVPIAAGCAPLFSWRRNHIGAAAAGSFLFAALVADYAIIEDLWKKNGTAVTAESVVALVKPRLKNCLYVWNSDPIFYYLTRSCLPSRFALPNHLSSLRESTALGIDQVTEVERILATKPGVIIASAPFEKEANPASLSVFRAALRQSYQRMAVIPLKGSAIIIYVRKKAGLQRDRAVASFDRGRGTDTTVQ